MRSGTKRLFRHLHFTTTPVQRTWKAVYPAGLRRVERARKVSDSAMHRKRQEGGYFETKRRLCQRRRKIGGNSIPRSLDLSLPDSERKPNGGRPQAVLPWTGKTLHASHETLQKQRNLTTFFPSSRAEVPQTGTSGTRIESKLNSFLSGLKEPF